MAGSFGWDNMNMQDHHHQYLSHASSRPNRPPPYHPQIACRICLRVFFSTEALIDHIESHMKAPNDHNFVFSSRDQLLNLQNPYFLSAAARQSNQQLRNPNLYPGNISNYVAPASSVLRPDHGYGRVQAAVWMNRSAAAGGGGGGTRLRQVQEYSWVPVTRPFLNQLEHALVTNAKPAAAAVSIIESQNNINSDLEALDLSLKL